MWQNLVLAFLAGVGAHAWGSTLLRRWRRGVPLSKAAIPERRRVPNVTEVP